MLYSRSTSSDICGKAVWLWLFASLQTQCSTVTPSNDQELLRGTILYPFADRTDPLGKNGPDEKFVVKSAVGNTEYTIEIPNGARDYDIIVPLAELQDPSTATATQAEAQGLPGPETTDRELVAQFPKLEGRNPEELALVDAAFGASLEGGPKQGPSYSLKLAKISKLYQERKFEYALIEINNLLAFHPNSIRLYKMKGTVLVKLRNFDLALKAWLRASELEPNNGRILKAIERLKQKIRANEKAAEVMSDSSDLEQF